MYKHSCVLCDLHLENSNPICLHHLTRFGCKRLRGSEDIFWTEPDTNRQTDGQTDMVISVQPPTITTNTYTHTFQLMIMYQQSKFYLTWRNPKWTSLWLNKLFYLGIAPWTLSAPTVSLFLFRSKHTNDYLKRKKEETLIWMRQYKNSYNMSVWKIERLRNPLDCCICNQIKTCGSHLWLVTRLSDRPRSASDNPAGMKRWKLFTRSCFRW